MLAYTIALEVVPTIIIPAQTHTNKQCLKQGSTNKQANNVNQPEQIDERMAGNLTRAIRLCPKNGYPKISIRIRGKTFSDKPISSLSLSGACLLVSDPLAAETPLLLQRLVTCSSCQKRGTRGLVCHVHVCFTVRYTCRIALEHPFVGHYFDQQLCGWET